MQGGGDAACEVPLDNGRAGFERGAVDVCRATTRAIGSVRAVALRLAAPTGFARSCTVFRRVIQSDACSTHRLDALRMARIPELAVRRGLCAPMRTGGRVSSALVIQGWACPEASAPAACSWERRGRGPRGLEGGQGGGAHRRDRRDGRVHAGGLGRGVRFLRRHVTCRPGPQS